MRWKDEWILFEGPFELCDEGNSEVFSIACPYFFDTDGKLYKAQNQTKMDFASWQSLFRPESNSGSFQWQDPSRSLYAKSFQNVMAEIRTGNWKKAVPIAFARSKGTLTSQDKKTILSRLSSVSPNLIPYGFWKDGAGMIGLTPEVLFFRNEDQLESMALAGTQRKPGPCQLMEDAKNLKEHDFVVKEINEKLQKFGSVNSHGPKVLELPTLFHLLTEFSVELNTGNEAWSDLKALQYFHPTSALGISPFLKWRELENLPEQKDRKFFGAPFLLKLSAQKSLALVALRQIQWDQDEIKIGAGGGIVQESQEELEWLEILAKIDSVKKLLGIS